MTNEMPKEAGEWWTAKNRKRGYVALLKTNNYGFGLCAESPWLCAYEEQFKEFDWHRIELPEGWK